MSPTDVFSIETALRGLAVFTAGCGVVLLMRRASAAARHHVLLCTMVAAVVIPLAAAVIPQWKVVPRWRPNPQAVAPLPQPIYPTGIREATLPKPEDGTKPAAGLVAPSAPQRQTPSPAFPWRRLAATIWLGGSALMLASSLAGMLLLRRVEKRAIRCDAGPLHDAVSTLVRETSLRRGIRLFLSKGEAMPMVWGIFRHRLLLPASAVAWPESRLRIVLLHELSHLRRNDPAALLFARIALAFHWFNPLAWMAHRQLRADQECACDDLVLSRGVTAPDYADEMLGFSADLPSASGLLPAPMMLRDGGLEKRIRGILDGTLNRRPLSSRGSGNIALLAALLAMPLAIVGAADLAMKPTVRGRILDRNGVVLAESPGGGGTRRHPFGALGVHLVGATNPKGGGKGTVGVEESYEGELSAGKNVTLTLDARIQSVVESVLQESGIGQGAVVILDPENGDVLASASVPSFDPGTFTDLPEFGKLRDSQAKPFLNRAITAFTPGSTFSIVPSLAASRTGHEAMRYGCGVTRFGRHSIGCWLYNKSKESHGEQNFAEAFPDSCGTYFNRLSMDVGFQHMSATAGLLGLGRLSGIRLPGESPGTYGPRLPEGERVSDVETCFIGIGQGNSAASPLQMASIAATVANGGRVLVPRIDLSVPVSMTADLREHGITPERILELQGAMVAYVEGPVGRRAHSEKVAIAGRTGTAQTMDRGVKTHNAWFIGYVPADAPRYAFAVMVQNGGSGGGVAGPIARRIAEIVAGDLPAPLVQEPNEGHTRRVEAEDMMHMTP